MKNRLGAIVFVAVVVALPFLTVSLSGQCPPYTQPSAGPCTHGLPTPLPTCNGLGTGKCPLSSDEENDQAVEYDVNSTSNWVQAPTGNKTYTVLSGTQALCWTRYNCLWDKECDQCDRDETTATPSNWFPYQQKDCPGG